MSIVRAVNELSFYFAHFLCQNKDHKPSFIVDDKFVAANVPAAVFLRKQNRNYLRVGENLVEIITRDDAKFLYLEGRIKKFALADPTNAELAALKEFYAPAAEDVLIFER